MIDPYRQADGSGEYDIDVGRRRREDQQPASAGRLGGVTCGNEIRKWKPENR